MVIRELLAFASGVFLLYVRILRGQIFVVPSDAVFVVFRPSLLLLERRVPPKERSRPARHTQVISE